MPCVWQNAMGAVAVAVAAAVVAMGAAAAAVAAAVAVVVAVAAVAVRTNAPHECAATSLLCPCCCAHALEANVR